MLRKSDAIALLEQIERRMIDKSIKVSTAKFPHSYFKAVGTREISKIINEFKEENIDGNK